MTQQQLHVPEEANPTRPALVANCRAKVNFACPTFALTSDLSHISLGLNAYSLATPSHPLDAVTRARHAPRHRRPRPRARALAQQHLRG